MSFHALLLRNKKPSKARLRGFGGLQKELRPLPPLAV